MYVNMILTEKKYQCMKMLCIKMLYIDMHMKWMIFSSLEPMTEIYFAINLTFLNVSLINRCAPSANSAKLAQNFLNKKI